MTGKTPIKKGNQVIAVVRHIDPIYMEDPETLYIQVGNIIKIYQTTDKELTVIQLPGEERILTAEPIGELIARINGND